MNTFLRQENNERSFNLVFSFHFFQMELSESDSNSDKGDKNKGRGRTGWPQHVWASELKP